MNVPRLRLAISWSETQGILHHVFAFFAQVGDRHTPVEKWAVILIGGIVMERTARRTRPQLVCVLADNSNSMMGAKAEAATRGIRNMLIHCQAATPDDADYSYFRFLLIRFADEPRVEPSCDMTPVYEIEAEEIVLDGRGGMTNITAALQLVLDRVRPYMQSLQEHPERKVHPIPLILLFSDGKHNDNLASPPQVVANELKQLTLDGDPLVIAVAGVSVGGDKADEDTLREIASPECYVTIENVQLLARFIAAVASSGASRAKDIAQIIKQQVKE